MQPGSVTIRSLQRIDNNYNDLLAQVYPVFNWYNKLN